MRLKICFMIALMAIAVFAIPALADFDGGRPRYSPDGGNSMLFLAGKIIGGCYLTLGFGVWGFFAKSLTGPRGFWAQIFLLPGFYMVVYPWILRMWYGGDQPEVAQPIPAQGWSSPFFWVLVLALLSPLIAPILRFVRFLRRKRQPVEKKSTENIP